MDLSSIPAIDHHAHNIVQADPSDGTLFRRAFSEANDLRALYSVPATLCYRRSLRDIGELLGVEPTEEGILARRAKLGLEELTSRCFEASHLQTLLLDDGFQAGANQPLEWHRQFVPTHRVLRIETLAETMIAGTTDFEDFEARIQAALTSDDDSIVAYKSIACYRTGLEIHPPSGAEARQAYLTLKGQQGRIRLTDKALIDYLVGLALEASARMGRPVQFHTGFGDPDLDLRLANPLHLRRILETPRFRESRIVLLHAAYPFMRESGYLASVYPQVHLDFGLAVPLLSVRGMRAAVGGLLELCPWTRVLYSSDAHLIPEMFYLGARWGRRILGEILEEAVRDRDLTSSEAEEAARAILAGNAQRLYSLKAPS